MAFATSTTRQHIALIFASVKCFLQGRANKFTYSFFSDLIATLAAPSRGGYGRLD